MMLFIFKVALSLVSVLDNGVSRRCDLDTGHTSSCFILVKYRGFVSFNVPWRCNKPNVRCADVDFLVPFRRVQLLACDAGQEIATFDSGRACHALEDT